MIHYRVRLASLNRHHFEVSCRVENPSPEQRFALPSWTPGSYLLREYAKHVAGIRAESDGSRATLEKVSRSTWRCRDDGQSRGGGRRKPGDIPIAIDALSRRQAWLGA